VGGEVKELARKLPPPVRRRKREKRLRAGSPRWRAGPVVRRWARARTRWRTTEHCGVLPWGSLRSTALRACFSACSWWMYDPSSFGVSTGRRKSQRTVW